MGKKPVYVNFHGGGWVFGGLATDFDFCKRVARDTGAVVFDVDYRLAPEEHFPSQVEDCWEALKWVCFPFPLMFTLLDHFQNLQIHEVRADEFRYTPIKPKNST